MKKNYLKNISILSVLLLTACGGGNGGGGGGIGDNKPVIKEPGISNKEFYDAAQIKSNISGKLVSNSGTVLVSGTTYIGLYSELEGKVRNAESGVINVKSGSGIYALGTGSIGYNAGIINEVSTMGEDAFGMISNSGGSVINESTGVINVVNQVGMRSVGIGSTATNQGKIKITGTGVGMSTYGGQALNDTTGSITGNTGTGIYVGETHNGIQWVGGKGINKGNISFNGDGAWGMFSQFGDITNEQGGSIFMSGDNAVGMYVSGNGKAINNGTITMTGDNAIGIYALGWDGSVSGINNGVIDLTGATNSTGIHISGGKYVNNGTIRLGNGIDITNNNNLTNSTNGNRGFFLENGASLLNTGNFSATNSIFNTDSIGYGKFIMSKNGKLSAEEIMGDIYLDGAGITDLYSKYGIEENALYAKNLDVNLISSSAMYDSYYTENANNKFSFDLHAERRKFNEIVKNESYSTFLENNIFDSNNKFKDEVYGKILTAETQNDVNNSISLILGDNIFRSIQNITHTKLSNRNEEIRNIALSTSNGENFILDEWIIFGDYNHSYKDSSSTSTLAGYTENSDNIYLGGHKYINNNLRLGGIISVDTGNAKFKGSDSEYENTNYHFSPIALYQKANYNILLAPYLGYTKGELSRDLGLKNTEKSDIDTNYYGIYGEISKEFLFDNFYLVPRMEINGTIHTQKSVNESTNSGINIPETDYNSFVTGVGTTLGRRFILENGFVFGASVEGSYYHEFGNPNNAFENITLDGFNGNFGFDSYGYNRDYGKFGVELSLMKNGINGYINYKYFTGRTNDDKRFTAGINYTF